jgi:hypothetical protein
MGSLIQGVVQSAGVAASAGAAANTVIRCCIGPGDQPARCNLSDMQTEVRKVRTALLFFLASSPAAHVR